mgnify:CR=1 FL=1
MQRREIITHQAEGGVVTVQKITQSWWRFRRYHRPFDLVRAWAGEVRITPKGRVEGDLLAAMRVTPTGQPERINRAIHEAKKTILQSIAI